MIEIGLCGFDVDFVQGDVESVASKNSKELTGLVEQISGSDDLKKEYEELEEKKAIPQEKAALIYQKKKTIGAEKKLKKAQKEEAEKHLKLQEELVVVVSLVEQFIHLVCEGSYPP